MSHSTSTYAEVIHATLRAAVNVAYPTVTYPTNEMVVNLSTTVTPKTILVYADDLAVDDSRNFQGGVPRERRTAGWIAELHFDREVSTESVENSLMASPPRIARGSAPGIVQQVTLELLGASYVHPVRGQPAQGTRVRFRFNANFKRI